MANAPYVRYGGNFLLRQPYLIQGVTGYGFAVEGNRAKMQALCDRTLNLRNEAHYHVVTSTVLFTFMRMEHLRSEQPPDSLKGSFGETELNLTMLLVGGRKIGPLFIPDRLVWHMPYLWVDSGPAMIAGREVYGYPKQIGVIDMPLSEAAPPEFSCTSEVFHRFGEDAQSTMEQVIAARRTDSDQLEVATLWPDFDTAFVGLANDILQLDLAFAPPGSALARLTLDRLLALVFLKQFRSIEDGSQACYQAVCETTFDLTRFGGAGLLDGDYEVEIFNHDSVPIAEELGFAATDPEGNARVPARLGYYVNLDFRLNAGREIWVAS